MGSQRVVHDLPTEQQDAYTQKPNFKKTTDDRLFKNEVPDFPGGPVNKNLPASAGDTDLIPDPGRLHIPLSN